MSSLDSIGDENEFNYLETKNNSNVQ